MIELSGINYLERQQNIIQSITPIFIECEVKIFDINLDRYIRT